MIVDAAGAQVSLCVDDYNEMHWELINLHPGVSAPAHG